MIRYKSFWILSSLSVCIFFGCSSWGPRSISLLNDKAFEKNGVPEEFDTDANLIFGKYCKSGKQQKKVVLNVKYMSPKPPAGTPIDQANSALSATNERKTCIMKTAFQNLSSISCQESADNCSGHQPASREIFYLTSDSKKTIMDYARNIRVESKYSNIEMAPIVLRLKDQATLLSFFEPVTTDTNGNRHSEYGPSIIPNRRTYLYELYALKNAYTMMVPKSVQDASFFNIINKPYDTRYGKNLNVCGRDYVLDNLGLDENGVASPTKALEARKSMWDRYFLVFTSIKEALTSDPQETDYEISLDLNQFCQYARNVGDLTSK